MFLHTSIHPTVKLHPRVQSKCPTERETGNKNSSFRQICEYRDIKLMSVKNKIEKTLNVCIAIQGGL